MMPSAPWRTLRWRGFSWRVDRRVPLVLSLGLLALLAALILSISVGTLAVPPLEVLRTLLRTSTEYDFIVLTLRLPRTLIAALVGVALALAGTLLQGLTRNPLAEPSVLGMTAGAGLAAVSLLVLVDQAPAGLLPLAAFGGATLIALLMYLLAWRGGDSPMRLLLIGIGLNAVCTALITLMITFGDLYDVQKALIWLGGSLYGRSWAQFWLLLPWVALGLPLALMQARQLNVLGLGDELARSLGSQVYRQRGLAVLIAVGLTAASVAAVGTLSFVGLVAPHLARRLVGADHAGVLPVAGVLGALLVVLADVIGRTLFAPIELPCGLIISIVGAPFFLWLLWQQRKGAR